MVPSGAGEALGVRNSAAVSANNAMRLPILIVLHQENSTPGRVGNALRERGLRMSSA